jgi:hypothetical protein
MIASNKSIRRLNVPRVIRSGVGAPVLYGPNGKPIVRERDRNNDVQMFHFIGSEKDMGDTLAERGGRGMQHLMESMRDCVAGKRPHNDPYYRKTTDAEPMAFERNGDSMIELFQRIG